MSDNPAVLLYADSSYGIYIPRHFAETVDRDQVAEVSPEDWAILEAGPEHEYYWETWDDILYGAMVGSYVLYQDGDLWLLDLDRMSEEEKANFGFE